jgi:hypothetical protein
MLTDHIFAQRRLPVLLRGHFDQCLDGVREKWGHRLERNPGHFRGTDDQNFAQQQRVMLLEEHDQRGKGGGELLGGVVSRTDVVEVEDLKECLEGFFNTSLNYV